MSDLMIKLGVKNIGSRRELNDEGREAALKVAEEIVAAMDDILKEVVNRT